ncbi:hypothetical protein [Actinosynnema sp. ALI-1.44]|uniref:hypothetical protein n=1 Tax=Actinosynnema sp. ALI-1.44 TaxID=1933779 RepID=UPI001178CC64|nr:hypothetical protein [Actinosynnema sp. ALI-1.44]
MTLGEHADKQPHPSPDDDADPAQRLTAALQQAKLDAGLSFTQLAANPLQPRHCVALHQRGNAATSHGSDSHSESMRM